MSTPATAPKEFTQKERSALLEQFKTLPDRSQSTFVTEMTLSGVTDPNLITQRMASLIAAHQHNEKIAVSLPSPEISHESIKHEALKNLAVQADTARIEVSQALERGESADQIQAKVKSSDNAAKAAITEAVRDHQEDKKLGELAKADAAHRDKVGLSEPEPGTNRENPFASLISSDLRQQIAAAMGGGQQATHLGHDEQVGMASGGKNATEARAVRA